MPELTPESPEQAIQRWLKGEIKSQDLFALSPHVMHALAEHGYMLYEQGKYRTARVVFEGLAAIDANNVNYNRMLGSIYQMLGEWDAAYYRYTLTLRAVPNDIVVLTNRGEVLIRLSKTKEAAEDLKQAILLDAGQDDPSAKRARILISTLRVR